MSADFSENVYDYFSEEEQLTQYEVNNLLLYSIYYISNKSCGVGTYEINMQFLCIASIITLL